MVMVLGRSLLLSFNLSWNYLSEVFMKDILFTQ